MKTIMRPRIAWAIVDTLDTTIMERTGTGLMNIFYSRVDAEYALNGVKQGSDAPTAKRLAIVAIGLTELPQKAPAGTDS